MILLLLLVPLAGGVVLVRTPAARLVHGVTSVTTLALGLAVAGRVLAGGELRGLDGLLRVDALSAWMIVVVVAVSALAAGEAPRYVAAGPPRGFYALLHVMIFAMLAAVSTDDVGLMWVAVEGTTLASVFLVNFERTRASLEAAYKYLLICSVGIAIAFAGTVLIYYAAILQAHGVPGPEAHALRWTTLAAVAPELSPRVVQLAFVFLVVGYGTKAGLAPMHTWLPDAHSEAPAPVSALMSGVLLSIGLYAVLRFKVVADAATGPAFAARVLIALGLLSLLVAAAFLWNPRNYKRMLAYSSVEHLGVAALGIAFGGALGVGGALLHVLNHGLAKSVLFLLAGRIRAAYGTASLAGVRGLLTALPFTGRAFLVGLLALMGLPPFGLFTSEVMILSAGFAGGHPWVAAGALAMLVVAFGGLLRSAHRMLYGPPTALAGVTTGARLASVPIVLALALLVLTGVAWPPALAAALDLAVRAILR